VNALFVQMVVDDKDMEAVVAALTFVLNDDRVRAGVMDAAKYVHCPNFLQPTPLVEN